MLKKLFTFFIKKRQESWIYLGGILFFSISIIFFAMELNKEFSINKTYVVMDGKIEKIKTTFVIFQYATIEYDSNGTNQYQDVSYFPLLENYYVGETVSIKVSKKHGISTNQSLAVRIVYSGSVLLLCMLVILGLFQLVSQKIKKLEVDGLL